MSDYTVHPISENDLKLVLRWRNSDRVHSQMLSDHLLTWDEHYQWYCHIKENPVPRNLIFSHKERPIGYIGYTEYDEERSQCSPGAYLGEVDVPIDAGLVLFSFCLEYAFSILGMQRLETSVFVNNRRAKKINEYLGYEYIPGKDMVCLKNGKEVMVQRYELTHAQWDLRKEQIPMEGVKIL